MRVFLDTNVLVSAFGTRGLCADVLQLVLSECELVVGDKVLAELERVFLDKFGVPRRTVDEIREYLRREGSVVDTVAPLDFEVTDDDDVVVAGLAIASDADYLVTGDADLLAVADKAPLRILSPREFWESIRGHGYERTA